MAVKAPPYKLHAKRVQSLIWSELIMADFQFPSAMRKALLTGVSIAWNREP